MSLRAHVLWVIFADACTLWSVRTALRAVVHDSQLGLPWVWLAPIYAALVIINLMIFYWNSCRLVQRVRGERHERRALAAHCRCVTPQGTYR